MSKGFYSKLAWDGIRKNKKFYTPYILTCIGMVMMYYIVSFLSVSPQVTNMSGGDIMPVSYTHLACTVLTDEKWLAFVMEQILSNALKYTSSGSIHIYTCLLYTSVPPY